MAETKAAKSPSKAATAKAEKQPKAKKLTFGGLKLTLPPELPETILFDFTEIEAAGDSPMPLFRMLRSILGPEQFVQLRNAIDSKNIEAGKLDGLVEAILGKYGVSTGESSASQDS